MTGVCKVQMKHLRGTTFFSLFFVFILAGFLTGCDKLSSNKNKPDQSGGGSTATSAPAPSVPQGEVLASVNGVPLSTGDIELRIQELKSLVQGAGQQWKPISNEQLQALLEDLINSEVMTQAALGSRLDQSPESQRKMAYARRQLMTQEWAKSMQDKLTVNEDDIQAYYEKNKQSFREPPRVQLRRIVVADEAAAKRAMGSLYGESSDFGALAQQVSEGPEAPDGGLMPKWIMRRQDAALLYRTLADADAAGVAILDPALEAAAFSVTELNGISNYAKGTDGKYSIFQLAEKKDGEQRELAAVHDNIKAFLTIQKVQDAIVNLKQQAKVERFVDRLGQVKQ